MAVPSSQSEETFFMQQKIVVNIKTLIKLILILLIYSCQQGKIKYYQCVTDQNNIAGIKAYTVDIDEPENINNPGLVILVRGVDENEGFVQVNGKRYSIQALPDGSSENASDENLNAGKAGWYSSGSSAELLGKVIIPLPDVSLKKGINKIVFDKMTDSDGYHVTDARLASINETEPKIVRLTYRVVTRGEPPRIDDFNFVVNYADEGKREESQLPEWAKRGKVRYYRAGINFENLDRMFEMFEEGHFNLVMLQVSTPHDTSGKDYKRYKSFIERCHDNGIRVTFDGGAGGQAIRLNSISADSVKANPEMRTWLNLDEFGNPRWRRRGRSYWPDLNNQAYRRRVLKTAELAIDSGVDELYYDWAIGGTKGIGRFFRDVQELVAAKGKNLTVFGNCKGNIIADGICDIGKSEGTEEAGVWDGKWVHNVAQAKFYYAAGDGWKPYRSKYEGADPGVPNPGAHSVIDEMKIGWKKPMAEAKAFQSDFVIAEAGRKLLNKWITRDDTIAMKAWNDICVYNGFFSEHEELFTDISTVSKIGLLAPPLIPSFEASVRRVQLYNALVEMNIMYDVLLLPRITKQMLANYELLIVPDIPWIEEDQLKAIIDYKENGGKIYVMGSHKNLQDIATINSPAYLCHQTTKEKVRMEFIDNLNKLLPNRIIKLSDSEFILANVVKKKGTKQVIVHFVNYSDKIEKLKVNLNLEGVVDTISEDNIKFYSPDHAVNKLHSIDVNDKIIEFILSDLEIYDIVVIN
jgi:hypothetical protein